MTGTSAVIVLILMLLTVVAQSVTIYYQVKALKADKRRAKMIRERGIA